MSILVSTKGMSREEWLEWRKKGIGSSDIAAIVGLMPRYRTQIDVWLEKTGQEPLDTDERTYIVGDESYPSEAAYWGTVHEDAIAHHFAALTGYKVQRRNAILQHPDYPFMLANLDRVANVPDSGWVDLECKSTSAYLSKEWQDEKVPLAYQAQVQWQLAIGGFPFGFIASLIGGNHFTHTRIERDEAVIAMLIERAADFWQHVQSGTMPPVDGSEKCSDALADLYPESKAEAGVIDLPPTISRGQIDDYFSTKQRIKDLEEENCLLENKIKAEMGFRELAWAGDYKATWKTIVSNRVDVKRLKAEEPAVYAKYVKESPSRRFEIKKGV